MGGGIWVLPTAHESCLTVALVAELTAGVGAASIFGFHPADCDGHPLCLSSHLSHSELPPCHACMHIYLSSLFHLVPVLSPTLLLKSPKDKFFPCPPFPAAVPEVPSTRGVPACIPGLRDYPQELKSLQHPPQPSASPVVEPLWVAVPPPFFGERPSGLLTTQEASLILIDCPEQGPAPCWSEVSVNLQCLVSIAADLGSKETEPAQQQKLGRRPQGALPSPFVWE